MDTFHPSFVVLADRPLLGAVALAACLAGGTATQSADGIAMAGVPTPVSGTKFAPGWEAGAPAAPGAVVEGLRSHLATTPQAAVHLVGPARHELAPQPRHLAIHTGPIAPVPVSPVAALVPEIQAPLTVAPLSVAQLPLTPVAVAPKSVAPVATPAALAASTPVVAVSSIAPLAPDLAATPAVEPSGVGLVGSAAVVAKVPLGTTIQTVAPPAADPAPLKLLSSPELRRFDLAAYRKPAPKSALAASRKGAAALSAKARTADRLVDDVVYHQSAISVAGHSAGSIAVRVGPDMKPSIKVADLLGLVSAQMDPDALARFSMASSAGEYVSFATLRNAGFNISYNAGTDSIAISAQ
ncbi:MAG: hypothetical protein KGM18_12680 [Sphingomonadales bacterium]|nr:hypothetical protein [Sphingomonadales bacterium]